MAGNDMSEGTYRLYGMQGWGSAITETMLALCGVPYEIEDVKDFDRPGDARERLLAVNPLAQVPTLVLPDGSVLTESAAIALYLDDRHPEAGLVPPRDDPRRPQFLRWLVWLIANVYPTFTYADYPERFAVTDDNADAFRAAVRAYRERLWQQFEQAIGDHGRGDGGGFWAMGDAPTALDVYIAVMSHFTPRRAWFAVHCPRLAAIAGRADAHPVMGPVLARNYPPADSDG